MLVYVLMSFLLAESSWPTTTHPNKTQSEGAKGSMMILAKLATIVRTRAVSTLERRRSGEHQELLSVWHGVMIVDRHGSIECWKTAMAFA